MPFYKTDLHCHTAEGSYCAHESTQDTIERYIANDFTSVVITNHLVSYWSGVSKEDDPKGFETYEEYVDHIYDVIDLAKKCADGRINVLHGIELCHCSSDNDYLIYGLNREMAKGYDLTRGKLRDMVKYVRSCGGIVIQAHPMRFEMTLIPPNEIDGYELYNNSKEWLYANPIVEVWAAVNCLDKFKILTAGNDHHDSDDSISAGIFTNQPIVTDEDLIRVLKSKEFTIFHETKLNCGY